MFSHLHSKKKKTKQKLPHVQREAPLFHFPLVLTLGTTVESLSSFVLFIPFHQIVISGDDNPRIFSIAGTTNQALLLQEMA